jgi:hypothetical protein
LTTVFAATVDVENLSATIPNPVIHSAMSSNDCRHSGYDCCGHHSVVLYSDGCS